MVHVEMEVAPAAELQVPGEHGVQAGAPAPLHDPAAQLVQDDAPGPLNLPAAQVLLQSPPVLGLYVPGEHAEHCTVPLASTGPKPGLHV